MAEIHRWQYQYLGTSVLPKTISPVELQAFFTFSEGELVLIRSRYKPNLRVAAAVQLGFLKMTGTPLEAVLVIPAKLLRHIATQLNVPALTIASLRAIYQRPKTLYDHQWWAMEALGFTKAKPAQLSRLLPHLRQEAQHAATVDVLVERGKLWLYQHQFISVGDRVIRDFARRAMADSEDGLFTMIREQVSEQILRQWEGAVLRPRPDTGRSTLEWLQQPPRRRSVPALRERIDQVEFLKELRIHELNFDNIAIEKIRMYAVQLHNMRPAKYREIKDPARTIRLVCFLKMALMQATDTAILMGGRQISKITRTAYEKARLLEAESIVSHQNDLSHIYEKVDDSNLSDSDFRQYVRALKAGYQPPQFKTRAEAARWILSDPNPVLRSLLNELQKLDIEGEDGNPVRAQVDYLRTLYRDKATALPDGKPSTTYPSPWTPIIEGPDRERAMRALEAATLIGMRKALRSGAVFVDHSEKFRGRHKLLIDSQRWIKEKTKRYTQLNLPFHVDELLDRLGAELEQKLEAVDAAIAAGKMSVQNGVIHLPKIKALTPRPDVDKNREDLFKKIGVVQLPDLILKVDSQTGFSKVILGRPAKSPMELLQVYAGMLAHGTSLDATGVSLMVPQLKPNQIIAGMQLFHDRDVVRAANDAVTGFHRRLPIAAAWGDGSLVSSDMMSLDVSRQLWIARLDPKRKIPSVGTYTHVADFWSISYDQPIVLNERQAGAAIEGVIRQTENDVERLAVDTHGYTEFAMAIAKLLGFALCPRLARLSERKLYVPRKMNIPESLRSVVNPTISLRQIRAEWDDLVRVAASIETGHTTATIALARFGSASSDSPIYKAGVQLGRLIRSIYLCDYFLSEELRRTINRILVHGEAVHQLQRSINAGSFSKPRGHREDELYAISGSLTLLSNLCLAWTASKMQEHLLGDGALTKGNDFDWLQYVSPAHFSNINFRGTFSFPINEYRESVLGDVRMAANG